MKFQLMDVLSETREGQLSRTGALKAMGIPKSRRSLNALSATVNTLVDENAIQKIGGHSICLANASSSQNRQIEYDFQLLQPVLVNSPENPILHMSTPNVRGQILCTTGTKHVLRLSEIQEDQVAKNDKKFNVKVELEKPTGPKRSNDDDFVVTSIACSRVHEKSFYGYSDGSFTIYRSLTDESHKSQSETGLSGSITAMACNHINDDFEDMIVVCDSTGNLKIWDVENFNNLQQLTRDEDSKEKFAITCVAFDPKNRAVVCGDSQGNVRLFYNVYYDVYNQFDPNNPRDLIEIEEQEMKEKKTRAHEQEVVSVAFTLDGKYMASGSKDGKVRLFEVFRNEKTKKPESFKRYFYFKINSSFGIVQAVDFSPCGRYLVVGTTKGDVLVFSVDRSQKKPALVSKTRIQCSLKSVKFSLSGSHIFAGGEKEAEEEGSSVGSQGRLFVWTVDKNLIQEEEQKIKQEARKKAAKKKKEEQEAKERAEKLKAEAENQQFRTFLKKYRTDRGSSEKGGWLKHGQGFDAWQRLKAMKRRTKGIIKSIAKRDWAFESGKNRIAHHPNNIPFFESRIALTETANFHELVSRLMPEEWQQLSKSKDPIPELFMDRLAARWIHEVVQPEKEMELYLAQQIKFIRVLKSTETTQEYAQFVENEWKKAEGKLSDILYLQSYGGTKSYLSTPLEKFALGIGGQQQFLESMVHPRTDLLDSVAVGLVFAQTDKEGQGGKGGGEGGEEERGGGAEKMETNRKLLESLCPGIELYHSPPNGTANGTGTGAIRLNAVGRLAARLVRTLHQNGFVYGVTTQTDKSFGMVKKEKSSGFPFIVKQKTPNIDGTESLQLIRCKNLLEPAGLTVHVVFDFDCTLAMRHYFKTRYKKYVKEKDDPDYPPLPDGASDEQLIEFVFGSQKRREAIEELLGTLTSLNRESQLVTALGERNGVITDHQIPPQLLNVKVHVSSVGIAKDVIELLQKLGWLKYFTYIHALESTKKRDFIVHEVLKGEEGARSTEPTQIVSQGRKDDSQKWPFVEEFVMQPSIERMDKQKQVCFFVDDNFTENDNISNKFKTYQEVHHQKHPQVDNHRFIPFWVSGTKDNNKPKEAFHKGEFKLQEGFENFNVHKVAQLLTTVRSVIDQHDPVAEAMCHFTFNPGEESCLKDKGSQSADGRLKTLPAEQTLQNLSACVRSAAEFGVDPWQN